MSAVQFSVGFHSMRGERIIVEATAVLPTVPMVRSDVVEKKRRKRWIGLEAQFRSDVTAEGGGGRNRQVAEDSVYVRACLRARV